MADTLFTPTEVTADLTALEKLLRRVAIEWEMFINQSVPWPPHQRQAEIEAIIRHYLKTPPRRTADRFRFNTLVHRYRTSCELWARRVRRREASGQGPRQRGRRGRGAEQEPTRARVLHQVRTREGKTSGDQMRDLYRAFRDARRARGQAVSRLAYRDFVRRIDKNLQQARRRVGGRDLELRVDEVGGKVRITVRPARDES
ncbi:MAG: MXAN_5187 C-terminal domain-containing protein [Acidobacteriota bacterium]|nr:MXAN_5187 C-terminal domain-containing protein [Acidobacteriota bacterium]